eukprot:6186894-Pleurochrysis_carterae.AAC.1
MAEVSAVSSPSAELLCEGVSLNSACVAFKKQRQREGAGGWASLARRKAQGWIGLFLLNAQCMLRGACTAFGLLCTLSIDPALFSCCGDLSKMRQHPMHEN